MVSKLDTSTARQSKYYLDKAREEIDSCVALDDALNRVLNVSLEALQGVRGAIALKNIETGNLDIKAKQDADFDPKKEKTLHFKLGEGIAGWVALKGKPYRWNGDQMDTRFAASPSGRLVFSLLVVPIKAHGAVTGVICVEGPKPDFFTAYHEELLTLLAEQAAVVIERSRFLETLIELGQGVTNEISLSKLLQRVAKHISGLLNNSTCLIKLQDSFSKGSQIEVYSEEEHHFIPDTPPQLIASLFSRQSKEIGSVSIYSPDQFSLWQQSLFNAFVKHASVLIENAQILEKYHKYVNILETLHRMSEAVTEALQKQDEEAVLGVIAKYSSQVLGTDVLTIYPYRDEEGLFDTPPIWIGNIKHPEYMRNKVFPEDTPVRVLQSKKKYHYWPRAHQADFLITKSQRRKDYDPKYRRFVVREEIASSSAVKLTVGDRPVGVVFFNFRQPQLFDSEQCGVIEAFANYTALALETLATYRRIRDSASKEEADRWNRELHDSVLQVLAGGVLAKAGTIKNQLRREDYQKTFINLENLEKAAKFVYDETQGIRAELSHRNLARKGLILALQDYIEVQRIDRSESDSNYKEPIEIEIVFNYNDLGNLAQETEHNLYRIAQEAIGNAIKNSRATKVEVQLYRERDNIKLTVEDNGCGFDVETAIPESFGLIGMISRAKALDGKFEIKSEIDRGTYIVAMIPST